MTVYKLNHTEQLLCGIMCDAVKNSSTPISVHVLGVAMIVACFKSFRVKYVKEPALGMLESALSAAGLVEADYPKRIVGRHYA